MNPKIGAVSFMLVIAVLSGIYGPYTGSGQPTPTETITPTIGGPTPVEGELGVGRVTTTAPAPATEAHTTTETKTGVNTPTQTQPLTTAREASERTPTQTASTGGEWTPTRTQAVGTENDEAYPTDYPPYVYADVTDCTAFVFESDAHFDRLEVTYGTDGGTPHTVAQAEPYRIEGDYGTRWAVYYEVPDPDRDRIVHVRALRDSQTSPPVLYEGAFHQGCSR